MNSTNIIIGVILVFALYYIIQALRQFIVGSKFNKASKSKDLLSVFNNGRLASAYNKYKKTIIIKTDKGLKSNIPSSEFISLTSTSDSYSINLKTLDSASGNLVGLGLFGTFLGLTLGLMGFENGSVDEIQSSIDHLLNGMNTAFLTSLIGMLCSLIFTILNKWGRNYLSKAIYKFTEKLDEAFYIDDNEVLKINQSVIANSLLGEIKSLVQTQFQELGNSIEEKLTYTNDGSKVPVGNAIREILTENTEQTRALKSFSTDLAIELNNGFESALSNQMQEKLLPLMENVDTTTKAIVEHIDNMAATVSSPATDMMQKVVEELKSSMNSIIDEFRAGLSSGATNELNNLAAQLGTATQAMAEFPTNMQNISSTLQVTIEEVKSAISEISNTSASANDKAMQSMQEQIALATGAISNAINEVKDVMSGITQTSQNESNKMVSKLADAAEKMGSFLNGTISSLTSSVQDSVKNIASDVSSKHADLIALQEDTTSQTKRLLEQFNIGLDRLEKMNEYIHGTMDMFQKAQGNITGSTAHLQTITGDMKLATELFNKSQNDYSSKMQILQTNSQKGIDAAVELIRNAGNSSKDYVVQFEMIKQGLGSIFTQLQNGLTEYSKTVQATTQKYLDQYSSSLTTTTDALSSAINEQSSVVEMLVESLNSHKR